MTEYIFQRIVCPDRILYAKITIDNGGEIVYYPKLISFGNIIIGSDDSESEMILYPGNFTISFHLDSLFDYYLAMGYLKYDQAEITIRENNSSGNIITKLKSKWETIEGNPIDRLITITFYDDYKELNEPFIKPDVGEHETISEIISETLGINFNSIEIVTDMIFQYIDDVNYIDFPLSEFAINTRNRLFDFKKNIGGTNYAIIHRYDTKGKVLVSLLNTFASYGVIGLNRTFYFLPRYYHGGPVVNINKADTYDGQFSTSFTKNYDGLRIYQKTLDVFYAGFNYGNVYPMPDTIEEFVTPEKLDKAFIINGLNSYDESNTALGTASGIRRKDSGGTLYYIAINSAKYKQSNGSYSAAGSLQKWVGNLIWSNTIGSRRKYFIELKGINYNFTQYFTIEGESTVFRPIKMSYNFMKNTTELTLVEAPQINDYTPVVS